MPSTELPPSTPADRERDWSLIAINFLPGLLAGTQIAAVLFFLNPELSFSTASFIRASLLYGGLLGVVSALVLTLLTWRFGYRARRTLPWSVTLVLIFAALLNWLHPAYYSYFLPSGINVRMIKAAIILTLIALACFYTALLHTVNRRPYSLRSRVGLALLVLASVYFVAERRESFQPRTPPPPLPSVIELEQRPLLLVVGLDGATLDAILPLARQGRLPFFARLIETGAYARLNSFPPARPPALWTTLATGRLPYDHGILDDRIFPLDLLAPDAYIKLLPRGIGFARWGTFGRQSRATDATFRRSPALWEILDRLGVLSGSVGWPMTYPVSESLVFAFSDHFFGGDFSPSNARPEDVAQRGQLFRVEPEDIDASTLEAFGTRVPYSLIDALAGDLWRESLTGFLLEQGPEVQAVFLMLPGLGTISKSHFGGYAAVQFGGTHDPERQQAAQIVTSYYRHLDRFLAAVWQRAAEPRILAVVSPYGYEAPTGMRRLGALAAGRSLEGFSHQAPDGVLMLVGEGVRPGTFLEQAELIDVFPSLLYALGLPIARDLDGRVLTSAFSSTFLARQPLTFVPSYDTLAIRQRDYQLPKPLES